MVALKFEGLEGSCGLEECYVSVRIGSVQKLSRMTAARRVYDFPETGEPQKYGRVEIFRRIASWSIDLAPQAGTRPVHLSSHDPCFADVNTQVTGSEDAPREEMPPPSGHPPPASLEDKRSVHRQMATDYLGKHCLESQICSVMKAVLEEMPENPTEFLAARFLDQCGTDGRLRLLPVSARLASAALSSGWTTQEHTLPRSPAEPSLQRGKKPVNNARKLAPIGSAATAPPATGQTSSSEHHRDRAAGTPAQTREVPGAAEVNTKAIKETAALEARQTNTNGVSVFDEGIRARIMAAMTGALDSGELPKAVSAIADASDSGELPRAVAQVAGAPLGATDNTPEQGHVKPVATT